MTPLVYDDRRLERWGHEFVTPGMEEIMSRYLDTPPSVSPPSPDLPTHIRTNPRLKGVLWTVAIGGAIAIVFAVVVSHVV